MEILEGYVVCNDNTKERILSEASSGFLDYTFLTEDVLIKKLLGEAKPEALIYLMDEYNLTYEMANEYLKYMPYLSMDSYNDLKLDSILSAKNALIKNNLYTIDSLFLVRLKRTPLTIIDFNNEVVLNKILPTLKSLTKVYIYEGNKNEYKHKALLFKDKQEEGLYVMNSIYKLYNEGVSLNNIYILNMCEGYEFIFKRLSMEYNLPIAFNKEKNILGFSIARQFISLLETESSFDEIVALLDKDDEYFKPILDLIIKYNLKDKNPKDYVYLFEKLFKVMPIDTKSYLQMVRCSLKESYSDNDYVFFLGCNLGATPRIYKDDEYLNDSELKMINLPTSIIKNKRSKDEVLSLFKHTKNLYISLRERDGKDLLLPANLLAEAKIDIEGGSNILGINKVEDRIKLGVAYTKYLKYKIVGDDLRINDEIRYNEFDNKFKGISKDELDKRYADKPLKLAYSNLKTYYACPFAYYLDKVLDLNEYKGSSATRLGTFAHKVLEESYNEDFNFNESITNSMLEFRDDDEEFKDYFYMNEMKAVLSDLIDFNREHESLSRLDNVIREAYISYEGSDYTFIGFIDKLMYTQINGEIYAAIVDYKTGSDYPSLDNVCDGFNLQLPCYMFLLKNYPEFKDKKIHIIGIYLQKINIIALDNTINIVDQRRKNFKLKGYSTTDLGELLMLDTNPYKSDYIQSMTIKKDGGFGQWAKVINASKMDELIELTGGLIEGAAKDIHNAKFPIEPKRIDNKDKSCTFCKYKDICFKRFEDYKDLELKPFLKEDED